MNLNGPNASQRPAGKFEEPDNVPLSYDADDGLSIETTPVRRNLGLTTLLLVSVVLVAIISVAFMRTVGSGGGTNAGESGKVVDDFLKARTAAKPAEALPANLLDTDGYAKLQIQRDDLRKNPFVLASAQQPLQPVATNPGGTEPATPAVPAVRDDRPMRISAWEAEVEKAAAGIKVQSTITGSRPDQGMANINGKVLRPGEMLSLPKSPIVYIVREISSDGVVFEVVNEEYRHSRRVTVNVNRNF
ncbi:MAG: hypothetical protein ACKO0W_12585 [Planctomycetota bacterium]